MYVEPLEFVDESLVGKAPSRVAPKAEKKKGGGLLATLFGSKEDKDERPVVRPAVTTSQKAGQLPEGVPREQIKLRCQECQHLAGIDAHSGYCDNCGAFYVEPLDYVTPQTLAAELEAQQADLEKYKPVEKTFEEMDDVEKLDHFKEKVADTWDQIVKDRYVLNEKANECMQCFTAAGTIKSEDQYEVLASMIKQRYQNLKDFEIFYREYQQLLDQFSGLHQELLAERKAFAEQQQKVRQTQTAG
ncbi:MAG: hypothetical protein ACAI44_00940 [Candidatus Sericytochromatia bacterium]